MPLPALQPKINTQGKIDPNGRLVFEMPEPLAYCDTSAIHLQIMIDSVWYDTPHEFRQTDVRFYELAVPWQPEKEYLLEVDSAAFQNIYGRVSKSIKENIKVRSEDEFGTLFVTITNAPITANDSAAQIFVQLMDRSDKVVRQEKVGEDMTADFFYLKPGKYFLRAYVDLNGNGQWDTGIYDQDLQAEPVFYNPEEIESKAKWDINRSWNLTAIPRYRQKPLSITKQKPDKEKQQKNRNLERAKKLGIQYVKGL